MPSKQVVSTIIQSKLRELVNISENLAAKLGTKSDNGTEMEYRCLWEESTASPEGDLWIRFSGKVGTYSACYEEQLKLRTDHRCRNVSIEARPKSPAPWLRPWEDEVCLFKYLGK